MRGSLAVATARLTFMGVAMPCERAWAQIDLSAEWAVRLHEDQPHRNDANYVLDLGQQLEPIHSETVDEIAGRPDGYVPHHLASANPQLREFAVRMSLPFEATRGGRDSTYPEYQLRLQQMLAK